MTLDAPERFKTIDRTPSIARMLQGAVGLDGTVGGGGDASATGKAQTFSQLLNSQTKAAATATVATQPAGAASTTDSTAKKSSGHALESAAYQLNHEVSNTDAAADQHAKVVKAAEGLVSNALILPILKQLRRSMESASSVFSGGNGEKSFGPEFDMQLADRIAKSPKLGVKNALVQRLEKRNALAAKAAPRTAKISTLDVHG